MTAASLLVACIASLNLGYVLSCFWQANGTRPFLVGYMLSSIILVAGTWLTVLEVQGEYLRYLRVATALALTGTLLWATYRHPHHEV